MHDTLRSERAAKSSSKALLSPSLSGTLALLSAPASGRSVDGMILLSPRASASERALLIRAGSCRRRALMNQLEIWSSSHVSSLSLVFRAPTRRHTHLQPGLPHQLLLLVFRWIGVVHMSNEPSAKRVGCLLRKVAATLSLLIVSIHSTLAHNRIFRVVQLPIGC